jgi:hypothetical protein
VPKQADRVYNVSLMTYDGKIQSYCDRKLQFLQLLAHGVMVECLQQQAAC